MICTWPWDIPPCSGAPSPASCTRSSRSRPRPTSGGIPLGTLCKDLESAKDRIRDGFTFVGLGSDAHFILQYAGIQYGELHAIPEPPDTWCNAMKFYDGPGIAGSRGAEVTAAAPCPGATSRRAEATPSCPAAAAPPSNRRGIRGTADASVRTQRVQVRIPTRPSSISNPFPTYKYMRDHLPVYWWPEGQSWVVTRYDDMLTLLKDRRYSVEVEHWEHGPPPQPDDKLTTHQRLAKHGLFWMPVQDHIRVRKVLVRCSPPRPWSTPAGSIRRWSTMSSRRPLAGTAWTSWPTLPRSIRCERLPSCSGSNATSKTSSSGSAAR